MELSVISEAYSLEAYNSVAFTVLRGNICRKTEYSINPQMTRTELVPANKTKSTTNEMPRERSDFLKLTVFQQRFFCDQ